MTHMNLTYNPPQYGSSFNTSAYPHTFTQNNVLHYDDVTPIDESKLTWYTDLSETAEEVFDNSEHDINPNNGFHFHERDPFVENEAAPVTYLGSFLSKHLGSSLFTDPYNYHWTASDGRMGYHDYLFDIPEGRIVLDDGELRHTSDPLTYSGYRYDELVDDDLSNPKRFHGLYGLNQDGTLKNPNQKKTFDSSQYNDYTGTSYGEALHWLEVFATQSSYNKAPAYMGMPDGLIIEQFAAPFDPLGGQLAVSRPNSTFIPEIDIFDQGWGGLATSDAWQDYVQKHVIEEHGGFHDIYTPRAF